LILSKQDWVINEKPKYSLKKQAYNLWNVTAYDRWKYFGLDGPQRSLPTPNIL